MRHEESGIQEQFVAYIRRFKPDLLFTGGFAGERLSMPQAVRRKRMGYLAGSPDIVIFKASGPYHALFIEFKSQTGRLSPEQTIFMQRSGQEGYQYAVCHSPQEAVDTLDKYLKIAP